MSGNIMPLSINLIRFDTLSYRQYQNAMAFAIFEPQESIIIRQQLPTKFDLEPGSIIKKYLFTRK